MWSLKAVDLTFAGNLWDVVSFLNLVRFFRTQPSNIFAVDTFFCGLSLNVVFLGHSEIFSYSEMILTLLKFMEDAVALGKVRKDYKITTSCSGRLYNELEALENFQEMHLGMMPVGNVEHN